VLEEIAPVAPRARRNRAFLARRDAAEEEVAPMEAGVGERREAGKLEHEDELEDDEEGVSGVSHSLVAGCQFCSHRAVSF
jgi:hypothetical protein